ncbi:hypothetical protein MNBD_DELTA04-1064 [hydrothermal vent metagenome]|uniref:Uncharacterized protein n=1 Tax=hydrothermal vent metagenome TaxID=652676 RepID=A0A3B0VBG0_9ZZZZ
MDFKDLFERAWKIFTSFLPAMVLNTVVLIGVSIITLGILQPVAIAGYTQSLLLALRDQRKPEVRDLFSYMGLFWPLLGFTVLLFLAIMLGLVVLLLPGIIMGLVATFFCIYMLPLMTDRGMGLVDAIRESSRLALEKPVADHLVVVAIYVGLVSVGQSVILGVLFTLPLATLFVLSVYEVKVKKALPSPPGA